jgi:hypothetical protein
MKAIFCLFTCLLFSSPVGWAAVPADQGGAGTIDPATVTAEQVVRFSIGVDTGETPVARVVATDSAGNQIVGVILSRVPIPFGDQRTTIRSLVRKYDRSNNLMWSRERTVTSDSTGYYEEWGDGQAAKPALGGTGLLSLEIAGLAVDNQDNVFAVYNSFQPDCSTPGCAGLARSPVTMVAKFDATGHFLWRRATPEDITDLSNIPPFYTASVVKSFALSADASSLVLVDNFTADANNYHQTVAIKVAAEGTRIFANNYGYDATAPGEIGFLSTPIALTEDGSGNLYVVSSESPSPYTQPSFAQYVNVIRKLSSTGQFQKEQDEPLYPGFDPNNGSAYPKETWSAAQADAAGNLYVGGDRFRLRPSTSGPDQGDANQLVLKFNPDLTPAWKRLGPQAKGKFSGQARVEVVDVRLSNGNAANGQITVGGSWIEAGTGASQQDNHWETGRYAADDGRLVWHRLYQASASDPNYGAFDFMASFRVDPSGNVYAKGSISIPTGAGTPALIKYSDAGDLQFVKPLPDGTNHFTLPSSTNKPTFVDVLATNNKEVAVTELSNPSVVAAAGSLANISTRVRVGGNDNVLFGGFIVTGSPGTTKKVLIRAIGPSLLQAGVSGALADTTLEVHDSAGKVYTNNNWKTADPGQVSQRTEIEATGVPPSNDLESAIIATVSPGSHTAIARGAGGATGIGLVEVYDIDPTSAARIANISTRGRVETGDDVMIGGIIVLQPNPTRVIVRAIGPSLIGAGVPNALDDPQLELRDFNGNLIVSNDDWQTRDGSGVSQQAEIEETTIPPGDTRESAVRATLDPGSYTAIVRGKGGTTGVALVEVYRLP